MKNVWSYLILVLVIVGGIYGGYYYFSKTQIFGLQTAKSDGFLWGVTVNPDSVRKYNKKMFVDELDLVNRLGAQWIRIGYDYTAKSRLSKYGTIIDESLAKKINVVLMIDSSSPVTGLTDPYADGQKVATEVATNFKGKVKYYQILNEQGGTTIKGAQYPGEKETDFDPVKYQKVVAWDNGAIATIRKIDPSAKIIITCHWTHYAYIDMIMRDKVDFDILGWDWYSDMGPMKDKKIVDGTLLVDKLRSYNKPIILSEVNWTPTNGERFNEPEQSDFIQSMAQWAKSTNYIKGFFVHELVDSAPFGTQKANYFGLVKFKQISIGIYDYGDLKQAFTTYGSVIKANQ